MAYGLEIYNAAGVKTLSTSDRVGRYHGTYAITGITYNISFFFPVTGYSLDGTWFYLVAYAQEHGVVVTPAEGGFNVSVGNSGPTPPSSLTLRVWRG